MTFFNQEGQVVGTQVNNQAMHFIGASIGDWQAEIHRWARSKGWWDEPRNFGELMMLAATEIAEAFEEYRDGHGFTDIYYATDKRGNQKPEGIPVEIADVVIRLLDTCEAYGIDLEAAMRIKHKYNETRSARHGGKRA